MTDPSADRAGELVQFTPYSMAAFEGARVGFSTCLVCGAAILIHPGDEFDACTLHRRWHEEANRA